MRGLLVFLVLVCSCLGQEKDVPRLDGRIVGGQGTTIAAHPHQVSLLLLSVHICGGAIISDTWIITAAHCVVEAPIASFLGVRAGSSLRNLGGQVYSVLTVITHPLYSGRTLDFDIALLQVSAPILVSNSRTIQLPVPGNGPVANATAVITGWGALSEGGPAATILQVVRVPVISQQDCSAAYPSGISSRMFCAGLLGIGGKDSCQGDSGGPLVIDGVLYGIVSWGNGCARADAPGVYTNVPVLRTWVTVNSGI